MRARKVLTPKRALAGGFGVVAGFLAIASVAYACVQMVGDVTLTGPNGTQTLARDLGPVTGDGTHNYCPTREPVWTADVPRGGTLSALWEPGTEPCPLTPPDDTYDVRSRPLPAYAGADGVLWGFAQGQGCFFPTSTDYTDLGDMEVDDGEGTGDYTIPSNYVPDTAVTAHVFCIGDPLSRRGDGTPAGAKEGMLAPYQVL